MAEAVEEAFAAGRHLLVEAGTGVGKTLAYLLPAVRMGRRVVISTGTRNLQDQVFRRDVPLLRDRLRVEVDAAYLKGRDNYLCLHRFREFDRNPTFPEMSEVPSYRAVADWAEETERGDRGELARIPEGVSFWRQINARGDTCLGQKCAEYDDCFLVKGRREAAEAQLVIVNHHLLLADLAVKSGDFGAILPDYDHVVLDEAHLLEDVATSYFGRRVSPFRLRELTDDTTRFLREAGTADASLARSVEATRDACAALPDSFRGLGGGRRRLRKGLWTPARVEARKLLLETLAELAAGLAAMRGATEDLRTAARRAAEVRGDLEFITVGDDADHVRWVEEGARGASFHASPIDVSGALDEHLFGRVASAVLTSATLTVDGEFDFVRDRLGLADARCLTVPSPFDYPEQALLYLPEALPDPNEADFHDRAAEEVRALLELSGGRAFLLFTSYAGMNRMRDLLEPESERYALMIQGQGSRHALLERFRKTPRAVLLATASFWQGVDVPGEALSLVVIDRLPFEVPSDPVVEARVDRMRRAGRNPFREYQVPAAVIGLKQGIGRLIRTQKDRGVLAVLDPRIRTRSYGRVFLDSLPPFARTSDLADVGRFLGAVR
jgi:ATP-dependent DNA helicase DinG